MFNKELAISLSKLPVIETIIQLKNTIDNLKPFPKEISSKVIHKLKLDWNYNSNAIEGNQLNYGETVAFIMHGITAKGKTLKDHLDIKGHNEAINYMLDFVKDERDFTESDIRALHKMILVEEYEVDAITSDGQTTKKRIKLGIYKTSPNSVKTRTGEMHYYATVEETPILMNELMNWYNECKQEKLIHPIVLASLFHYQFVAIHPFDDGNGRLARILMNLILLRNDYLPTVIKNEDKSNYYGVLAQADSQQYIPLIEYMSHILLHTLNIQLKAINGECIEEETDIEKEIALLKKSLDKSVLERRKYNSIEVQNRLKDSISILIKTISNNIIKFNELFFKSEFDIRFINEDSEFINILRNNLNNFKLSPVYRREPKENVKDNVNEIICFIELYQLKTATDLNIIKNINILFNEFDYKIKSNNFLISKYYNEPLTQEEITSFVNNIMKDILNEIKQHTKQN